MDRNILTLVTEARRDPACRAKHSWFDDIFDRSSMLPVCGARKPNADKREGDLEDWA